MISQALSGVNPPHPLCAILHTPRRYLLVRANADVLDPDDLYHVFKAIDIFVAA